MPFSFGSHKCLGDKLAYPIMKIIYALINDMFDVSLAKNYKHLLVT
jgi:cytochrome P450